MSASDDYFRLWIESLAAEGIETGDLEADLIGKVGRLRIAQHRILRDMQAADLLKHGRLTACERLGVKPSTVYKMAHRWRNRSTPKRQA